MQRLWKGKSAMVDVSLPRLRRQFVLALPEDASETEGHLRGTFQAGQFPATAHGHQRQLHAANAIRVGRHIPALRCRPQVSGRKGDSVTKPKPQTLAEACEQLRDAWLEIMEISGLFPAARWVLDRMERLLEKDACRHCHGYHAPWQACRPFIKNFLRRAEMVNTHVKVTDDCKHKKLGFQCKGAMGIGCEYRACHGFEPYCCGCAKQMPKSTFETEHRPYADHYSKLKEKGQG